MPLTLGMLAQKTVTSAPIMLTYIGHAKSSGYNNQPIGTPAANRRIIVALSTIRLASTAIGAHSSLTVAGAACTKLADISTTTANAGGFGSRLSLWITTAPLVSGTIGDIVFSAGTTSFTSIITWAAFGVGSVVPFDVKTATGAAALSTTINCPQDGVLIAVAAPNASATATVTWTGVNEDIDADNSTTKFSGASQGYLTPQTGRAISVTPSATTLYSGALAAVTLSPV